MKVSYQGLKGAYSHLASENLFHRADTIPCRSFDEASQMVLNNEVDYAVIPIENAVGGRVAEVHDLLPRLNLWIIQEYFLHIDHCLLVLPGTDINQLKKVYSHEQALLQCRKKIRALNLNLDEVRYVDTAGAAKTISNINDKTSCAIASKQAAQEYNLEIIIEGMSDIKDNFTRFLVLQKEKTMPPRKENISYITSFAFTTRNIPAALYKCLGGFATNGVNFLRLESYMGFHGKETGFYAEILGHRKDPLIHGAFKELEYFTNNINLLGVYQASEHRN